MFKLTCKQTVDYIAETRTVTLDGGKLDNSLNAEIVSKYGYNPYSLIVDVTPSTGVTELRNDYFTIQEKVENGWISTTLTLDKAYPYNVINN